MMMLVHKSRIGKDGKKIECYPTMTSTPPNNRSSKWFNPSAGPTPETGGGEKTDEEPAAKKNLDVDMKALEDSDEVSPKIDATEPNSVNQNNDDKNVETKGRLQNLKTAKRVKSCIKGGGG